MKELLSNRRWVFFAIPVVLVVVGFLARISWRWLDGAIIRYVDVASERSISTWYSSGVLLVGGLMAFVIVVLARGRTPRAEQMAWRAVGTLLLVMSLDELVSIHEEVGRSLRPWVTTTMRSIVGDSLDGILGTGWIIPGIVVVVVIAGAAVIAYRGASHRLRRWFVAGFAVLVAGALGMEIIGSLVYSDPILLLIVTHVEEGLEMWGAALMLLAILRCVGVRRDEVGTVRLDYRG